ncbi:MAG: hypothetical protein U0Q11_25785 [Vicinamibacterales bacterium]
MTLYPSRYRILASLGVAAALMTAPALVTSAAAESVTLSGCLVKASGDLDPYLLINAPAQPALNQTPAADVNPTGVGTAAEFRTIFYWLKGNGELSKHVGHRVEVEGDLEGPAKGELRTERKDNWTEVTVKSGGASLKAEVPHDSLIGGPGSDQKGDVVVRRVGVEKVKMIAATCEP